MSEWVEVSKDEYYHHIANLPVNGRIVDSFYPYTTEHVMANGIVRARRVGYIHSGKGLAGYRYYLNVQNA